MAVFLQQLVNGITWGSVYALVALGYTMVYSILRLINFAQGSIYLVGAYIGWVAVVQLHTPLPLTIIVVAVAAAIVGLIIERFGLRPLQNSVRIAPLLTVTTRVNIAWRT